MDDNYELEAALVRRDWDAVVPTNECRHCKGTGKCDDDNECGFCVPIVPPCDGSIAPRSVGFRLHNLLARAYFYALGNRHAPCRHCFFYYNGEKGVRWVWLWCNNGCDWGNL